MGPEPFYICHRLLGRRSTGICSTFCLIAVPVVTKYRLVGEMSLRAVSDVAHASQYVRTKMKNKVSIFLHESFHESVTNKSMPICEGDRKAKLRGIRSSSPCTRVTSSKTLSS